MSLGSFVRVAMAAVLAAGVAFLPGLSDAAPRSSCPQEPTHGVPIPPQKPVDPLRSELALNQVWDLAKGAGVTVGVVDTGVDPRSPKLAGAVAPGWTYRVIPTAAGYTRAQGGQVDCYGHGTAVAGIVAGRKNAGDDRVSGIAIAARIYPVAIWGDTSQWTPQVIGAAIRDAADHSKVINLSFAQTTDSTYIRSAVAYALRRGVVVVAAVENDQVSTVPGQAAPSYPAAYPGVIAVAAVHSDGSVMSQARGKWISLAAPGDSLMTVAPGGHGYVTESGTSFAAAIVSGCAALLVQHFPGITPAQVAARLEQTADSPGDGTRDNAIGYGVVDPYAALTASIGGKASPSTPGRGGSVPVQQVGAANSGGGSGTVLAVVAALVALSVLVALATVSVRSGRRRGWHPGALPRAHADDRTAEPHPAELG